MLIQLPNAFGNAATNMAIDSALLSALPQGIALFRHYGWSEPAITFGYTQHFQAVQRTAPPGLALCRRTTGGGIVDHRNDWTYALIIQNALPAAKLPATEFYEKLHRCIQKTWHNSRSKADSPPARGNAVRRPPQKRPQPTNALSPPPQMTCYNLVAKRSPGPP